MITELPSLEDTLQIIRELANELTAFAISDVLVNVEEEKLIEVKDLNGRFSLDISPVVKKLHQQAHQFYRETGTQLMCVTDGLIQWEYQGRSCSTPLMICPIHYQWNKIKNELEITYDSEDAFLNPFLIWSFNKLYDFEWPDFEFCKVAFLQLESELREKGFQLKVEGKSYLGNFHHHRFEVLRDLENLIESGDFSSNLNELLNTGASKQYVVTNLPSRQLFASDNDQMSVFKEIEDKNVVVNGPPGTGKSQVLSNLIGKILYNNQSALVISEKRVALEVLQKKLEELDIEKFVYLPYREKNAKHLIQHLKKNWQWFEEHQPLRSMQLDLSNHLMDSLQFKLNVLTRDDLIGGVSFGEYQKLARSKDFTKTNYNSNTTSIIEFQGKKDFLVEFYSQNLQLLMRLIPQNLIEEKSILSLDKNIEVLEKRWGNISKLFPFDSKDELTQLMKKASFSQMMSNEQHQLYFKLLNPTGQSYPKFARLSKNLVRTKKDIDNYSEQVKNWRIRPSLEETVGLLDKIDDDSFFQRYRIKRRMNQILSSKFISHRDALEKWKKYCLLIQEQKKIEKTLLSLGISNERELEWVTALHGKLLKEDWEEWKKRSVEENNLLASQNAELHILYQNIRTFLVLSDGESISNAFAVFYENFNTMLQRRSDLSQMSGLLYKQVGSNETLEELELQILKSNWTQFIGQFSAFEKFEIENLQNEISEIISLQQKEGFEFAEKIKNRQHQRFDQYVKLLQVGTKKLSKSDRELKARLKKGRAILIKEFGKTRSHPTVRELLASEASEWIKVMIPVWMVNPAQMSNYFRLQKEIFDFALFDEATQIPLAHSLGAIHRAKRIVVVGDEHQMTPQFYFKSGESEVIDLLHQASFSWKKIMLKHHYRSQHPELISFSNRHFYNNELIAYPASKIEENAITLHKLEDGLFNNRQNEKEAKLLVEHLLKLSESDNSIGVVAFSETQLACILQQISPENYAKIDSKIESGQIFFRALENVQGEECDHLLISLGYGPNSEGKILLNFGPLNKKTGRRRLNVLLTRARKKIDFFASIGSQDLGLSKNDSLNLLRQFLLQIEKPSRREQFIFPYGLQAKINTDLQQPEVMFIDIFKHICDANELVTLQRVLESRNWKVTYA